MKKYYMKKIMHRTPLFPKAVLNIIQSKFPKARFFVRNILKIEIDKILVGDIHGISSYDWYELTGDDSRLEERIIDSSYYELFSKINNGKFSVEEIKEYRYFETAKICMEKFGSYCGCKNEEQLIKYIADLEGFFFDYKKKSEGKVELFVTANHIKDADLYEIVDGHHRVAMDAVLGKKYIYAFVVGSAFSGLQKKLFHVSMTNKKELYQPIEKISVQKWPTIRNCQDRFEMLGNFLKISENDLSKLTLVDIACSYGYFVNKFRDLGIRTKGVEIDKNSIEIGKMSYGLSDDDYINSSLQNYFHNTKDQYDIVCFFSILHHFGINKDFGGGGLDIKDLIGHIDKMTKKYLFLDSGQNHEYWFKNSLSQWDDEYIANLILQNSSFKSFEKLGVDNDNVGKYSGNYNRTLFVFKK